MVPTPTTASKILPNPALVGSLCGEYFLFKLLKLLPLLVLSLTNKAKKIFSARGACRVLQSVAAETLKEMFMKLSKISILLIGSALVVSSGAFAGEANKGKLRLQDKTIVDGKPLNPGHYTVEWTGTGPTVQVTLLQRKRTVATFSAHLSEQPKPNHDDAYGSTTEPDGSSRLTAIYISGKRTALELEQNQASQQSSMSDSR